MKSRFKKTIANNLITPERYSADSLSPEISYEHWHRYLSISHIANQREVLDVGCGDGYGAYLIAQHAKKVIALDYDKKTIINAQKKYKKNNLEFIVGSAQRFPIDKNSFFDLIVSFELIEHLASNDQVLLLKEVTRYLKNGGLFIVSTPNKKIYSDKRGHKNSFHIKEFYRKEFVEFLKKYFKYVDLFGQKIYSGSFIWSEQRGDDGFLKEHLIAVNNNGFRRTLTKKKEAMMFLAVCSNNKKKIKLDSVCIDLGNTLINSRNEEIFLMKNMLSKKDKYIASLKKALDYKDYEIKNISNKLNETYNSTERRVINKFKKIIKIK